MLSIIVAIAENYAIGKKGDLLCHLPADLKHFKEITSGKTVVMGERTFWSLPKHPLPNRRNIVLTDVPGKTFEGAEAVYSLEELVESLKLNVERSSEVENRKFHNEEAFVIGGGMVYRQMMPLADKLYITHIHHSWEDADTFFPEIKEDEWELTSKEEHQADEKNPYAFTFAEYKRIKN
ncbi:MAG: dihydrofolate reductase [Paludibacteraceae bacterium]|nr:dihydrofolate reductase [Paludibacteraceae bacterium]